MSKKFRCGRLLETRDGRIKKLDLGNGGGTRTCDWSDEHMTFDEVHGQLLTVFDLCDQRHQTTLYDFKHQPLDLKHFSTFADYIKQYGLNRNSTVVYICTSEMAHETPKRTENKKSATNSSAFVKKEPELIATVDGSSSSSEYSFTDTSLCLMKNMRELISQNPSNKVLSQLFENLCSIHGHVFSTIVPLQQLNENSNESEKLLYLHNLKLIYNVLESTKAQLNRNHDRFHQIQLFSLIETAFMEFYDHVKILRDRWVKAEEANESIVTSSTTRNRVNTSADHSAKSSARKLRKQQKREKLKIFKELLAALKYLLRLVKARNLSSFRTFLECTVAKVKSVRKRLSLVNHSSIDQAKTALFTIKNQLVLKQRETRMDSLGDKSDKPFDRAQLSALKIIRATLSALYSKEAKMLQKKQTERSQS